jgi:RNA polymerase sigma-70 factor (ECF subfamily)
VDVNQLPWSLAAATVDDLFLKSGAERWGLSREEFADTVNASVRHAFAGGEPSSRERDRYVAGLHVADMALAAACALGRETAWDHFVLEHRPVLYRAADSLDSSGGARELADSIYADLYGMRDGDPARRPLFRYFHGRSSLKTWLRAVLAQRHVDAIRARRRVEPLPDDDAASPAARSQPADPDRDRLVPLLENALRTAIDQLEPKDRLRVRSYYASQLTLAQIGRLTGEHEATVSRQLSRTRRHLKEAVERHLREQAGLSDAQVARAFELILEDPGDLDLLGRDHGEIQQEIRRSGDHENKKQAL